MHVPQGRAPGRDGKERRTVGRELHVVRLAPQRERSQQRVGADVPHADDAGPADRGQPAVPGDRRRVRRVLQRATKLQDRDAMAGRGVREKNGSTAGSGDDEPAALRERKAVEVCAGRYASKAEPLAVPVPDAGPRVTGLDTDHVAVRAEHGTPDPAEGIEAQPVQAGAVRGPGDDDRVVVARRDDTAAVGAELGGVDDVFVARKYPQEERRSSGLVGHVVLLGPEQLPLVQLRPQQRYVTGILQVLQVLVVDHPASRHDRDEEHGQRHEDPRRRRRFRTLRRRQSRIPAARRSWKIS